MAAPKHLRIEPIKGFEGVELDIDFYLTSDYEDVSRAAQELPSVIEWMNELRQAYAEERDMAKADLDVAEATAYFDLKGTGDGNFQANYQCKPTEDGVKMAIALDPAVRKGKEKIARLGSIHARLSGTIQALQSKVELLRSSEATRRTAFDDTTPSSRR